MKVILYTVLMPLKDKLKTAIQKAHRQVAEAEKHNAVVLFDSRQLVILYTLIAKTNILGVTIDV